MTQQGFFDAPTPIDIHQSPTLEPRSARHVRTESNPSMPRQGRGRAAGQRRQILDALRRGRAEVHELKGIASQYNARIYELRKAGYDIENVEHNKTTGESWYELKSSPQHVGDGVFHITEGA